MLIPMQLLSVFIFLSGLTPYWAIPTTAELQPPGTTYHLSFDDWSFLEDDYSARFPDPPFKQRNLRLVPGRFGQALLNDNVFVEPDFLKTHMSTRDLDVLLEVLCHHRFQYYERGLKVGRMHPYFWGTGRLRTDGGTVAFWAKGARCFPGYLFFQGSSSFGRLEKYLLAIQLNEDRSLEAFLVDARYRRHTIQSAPLWKDDRFNHVALVWDRSQGLTLYLNGRTVASNWGSDAWWTAQIPGLFHMPMCGFAYDELWIFDRPLDSQNITRLMQENRPPKDAGASNSIDALAAERLRTAFIGPHIDGLPVVRPGDGTHCVCFREVFPLWAGDGCVKAPCVMDGRYEMAWPMGYTSFTNILGDSDYQPEKLDFRLPPDARVNYVAMEGNLTDAKLLSLGGPSQPDSRNPLSSNTDELLAVPRGKQFFHGQLVDAGSAACFRIPFVKAYGSPPPYKEGLRLPLTGEIRIHEVGFFNVCDEVAAGNASRKRVLRISAQGNVPDDARCGYAMLTLNDCRNSTVLTLKETDAGEPKWISAGPFTRLNFVSAPLGHSETIKVIDLNLGLRHVAEDELVVLKLHDTGVPARTWTSVVFRLKGFHPDGGLMNVRLDMTDIKAAAGDRLWLDLAFSGKAEFQVGGKGDSCAMVEFGPLFEADPQYGFKALQPALSSFTKIYYWYYPWILAERGQVPSTQRIQAVHQATAGVTSAAGPPAKGPVPLTFGGYYDIVNYPAMVLRTEPDNFLANVLSDLSLVKYHIKPGYTFEAWENSAKYWPPIRVTKADDSPDWAFYMNYYLIRFQEIVHWWADRQNPDGQVGGGWNDDVLFASRLPGPFLYAGDARARGMFNRIFEGLEQTRMFHDGHCNITPMDSIHIDDLVRHRYEGLLFDPGSPDKMKMAMRTAWHWGRPQETPANYGDGRCFKYDRDLILWYWGRAPAYPAYSITRDQVTAKMKELAPAMNDVIRFRYTEAEMFSDGATMPGSLDVKGILVGGQCGPFLDKLSLAVSWEEGGDPSIPKWVEYASDTALVAHLYSYNAVERNVTARLYRLKHGVYRITLTYEGQIGPKGMILARRQKLRRFAKVTVPVRPRREMVLNVELEQKLPEPGPLPDLAVHDLKGADGQMRAEVLNLGPAAVGPFKVWLEDAAGRRLAQHTIPGLRSAADFVPAAMKVKFSEVQHTTQGLRVAVDPEDVIEEISKENNKTAFAPE